MQVVNDDIWVLKNRGYCPVITTNIGWRLSGGDAIMGRGLAVQAANLYQWLPKDYGLMCRNYGEKTPVLFYHVSGKHKQCVYTSLFEPLKCEKDGSATGFFLFPTKPLSEQPHLSWQQDSSLILIERSLKQLAERFPYVPRIAIPLVGCGNGHLTKDQVLPLIDQYLGDRDGIVLVERS